ncbi:recombinase family protein [Metabacillus litoralis]|uniref:recombinase family protein n=1 Tax=Metabacillus litoralis TaxID=152268 RepID=UPI001B92AB6B|nr:recombinase family protein [Metabacillus litoralis]UHA60643.1 recombinase family protein [Metabacillus litoralis]
MFKKVKTAITYARKSVKVKDVNEADSISYQQVNMDSYASRNNYKVLKRYTDVGFTGTNTDRPELIEMLNDVKKEKIDCLLVYSVDRFGRDLKNNIDVMLEITEYVDQIVFIVENLSSSGEYFKMFFLMLTAMAQEERNRILLRVADGRKSKILNRLQYDGKRPLGYVKLGESKKIAPASALTTSDEEKLNEIIIIEYIFYCYLMRMSLRKIARLLNEKFGLTKRGVPWNYKSVQYILKNQHYSGYLTGVLEKKQYYLEMTPNVQQLIDPLFQEKVIKMLDNEKVGRKKKNMLSPFLFCLCNDCGALLIESLTTLECINCKETAEKKRLIDEVIIETKRLISNSSYKKSHDNIESKLVKQYQLRINELYRIEERLLQNKDVIEKEDNFDPRIRNQMVSTNSQRICEVKEEIRYYSQLMAHLSGESMEDNEVKDSLILTTPYVIIVDFKQSLIKVSFHPRFFQKRSIS